MNIIQLGRLNRTTKRSKINRLLIFLLIIGLIITNVHSNLKIKDLQKQIKNSRIIIVNDDTDFNIENLNQPPKITDVRELQ